MIPSKLHDQFVKDLAEFEKDISKLKKAELIEMCVSLKLMTDELSFIAIDHREHERLIQEIRKGNLTEYVEGLND